MVFLIERYCAESSVDISTAGGDVDDEFKRTHYYQRVKYLLTKPEPEVGEASFSIRWRRKLIEDAPGFKFSRRIVCTFVLSAITTYQLGLIYVVLLSSVWEKANEYLAVNGTVYAILEKSNDTDIYLEIKDFFSIAENTFWGTCYFAIGTTVLYSFHMQICYRKHTLRLWKGNKDFCPRANFSFGSLVVANLRYSGYHIGFATWGFFILQIVSWAIVFFVVYGFIYPLARRIDTALLSLLSNYWLSFVVGLVLYYAQVILSQQAFLQTDKEDKKKKKKKTIHLSLNNRRAYNVTVYVTLFMNVLLGLVSCLMRIIKALIFGVLFIGRIDRCILMRGWELWDPGFKAYIGFLQLEVAHTHPVVITFCHLLWKSIEKKKIASAHPTSYKTFDVVEEGLEGKPSNKSTSEVKSLCARNRWFVAFTLMRNRALTISRVPILPELLQVKEESRAKTESNPVKYKWMKALSPPQSTILQSDYDHLTSQENMSPSRVHTEPVVHVKPGPVKKTDSPSRPRETDSLLNKGVIQAPSVSSSVKDCERQSTGKTDFNSSVVTLLKLEDNQSTETDI